MPIFLDTRNKPTLAIGVCDRCNFKFPLSELMPDRDKPGMLVCRKDNDVKDPWRLPFVALDANIGLPRARPDVKILTTAGYTVNDSGEVISAPFPVDTSVKPSST
jgi:hypothetical protein